jgi:YegS/Rv2252/BmrU family lipid kinase
MRKHLVFVVNPFSGTTNKTGIDQIIKTHLNHSLYTYQVFLTEYSKHAIQIVDSIKSQNDIYAFIAVGGDGTVNEVASQLVDSDKVLGIIPQGSGNGFGCSIGMSRNIIESLKLLNTSDELVIDTGVCNGQCFINLSGIGIDGQIVYKTRNDSSRGFFKYLKTTLQLSYRYKPVIAKVYMDNILKYEGRYATIVIANGTTYGYDFKIAPLADYVDGVLDLVLIKDEPLYKYFIHLPKYFSKGVKDLSFVINDKAEKIKVEIENESYYHLDGEGKVHQNDYEFEVKKSSLKILIPKR